MEIVAVAHTLPVAGILHGHHQRSGWILDYLDRLVINVRLESLL